MAKRLKTSALQRVQRNRPCRLIRTFDRLPRFYPDSPQERFGKSKAFITLFGSGAGCGKTFGLLLDFVQKHLVSHRRYSGVIFRRTYPEVRNEGGLWDESAEIYPKFGGRPIEGNLEWRFPQGATVRFSHLQHGKDRLRWQGSQVVRFGFDELTHFLQEQFWYLSSRMRFPAGGLDAQIKATCNPDAESWVAKLVDWYLDPDGFAHPDRSGAVRWFARIDGDLVWRSQPEDFAKYGSKVFPKSFCFIPAKLTDNPKLLETNPEYEGTLANLPPVDRMRLLEGNWKVTYESGTFFSRTWFEVVDFAPQSAVAVRFWDLAATSETFNKDACYTAGIKMAKIGKTYYVLDVIAEKFDPARTNELILTTARQDGKAVAVRWEKEPGASGKRDTYGLMRLLDGFDAIGIAPDASKLVRAKPLAAAAYRGDVKLLRADWNDRYLGWLQAFPSGAIKDPIDASSGAYNYLSREVPDEVNDLYQNIYGG